MPRNSTIQLAPRVREVLDFEQAYDCGAQCVPIDDAARNGYYRMLLRLSLGEFRQWLSERYGMGCCNK